MISLLREGHTPAWLCAFVAALVVVLTSVAQPARVAAAPPQPIPEPHDDPWVGHSSEGHSGVHPAPKHPEQDLPATEPKVPSSLSIGDFTLTPLIQARFRYEGRWNPYLNGGGSGPDIHFITTRARLGLDAAWNPVRIRLQIQDVRNLGTTPGTTSGTTFGLHQGYVHLGDDLSYVRLGRQQIAYGDQRLIGVADWSMNARAFDALRVHATFGNFELDAWGAMNTPPQTLEIQNAMTGNVTVNAEGDFVGAMQASWHIGHAFGVDAYVLYRHDGPNVDQPARERNVIAPGLRVAGQPIAGLKYTAEGTLQTGEVANQEHLAFALSGELGYNFGGDWAPEVTAGGAYGSGDSPDGSVDEFDNFFPTNHKFYGFVDVIGLRNLVEAHLKLRLSPVSMPLIVDFRLHWFALPEPTGRWSDFRGRTLGQSTTGVTNTSLGGEADLQVGWELVDGLSVATAYAFFIPHTGARQLGHRVSQHWAYFMVRAETP